MERGKISGDFVIQAFGRISCKIVQIRQAKCDLHHIHWWRCECFTNIYCCHSRTELLVSKPLTSKLLMKYKWQCPANELRQLIVLLMIYFINHTHVLFYFVYLGDAIVSRRLILSIDPLSSGCFTGTRATRLFQMWRSSRHSRIPQGRAQQSIELPTLPAGVCIRYSKLVSSTYSQLRLTAFCFTNFM